MFLGVYVLISFVLGVAAGVVIHHFLVTPKVMKHIHHNTDQINRLTNVADIQGKSLSVLSEVVTPRLRYMNEDLDRLVNLIEDDQGDNHDKKSIESD